MNLLFIEPESRFYEWLEHSLSATDKHQCTRAENLDAAESALRERSFDACFIDITAFPGQASAMARARVACKVAPLIMLTGSEVRADLAKICDGIVCKAQLTTPATEIPTAVNRVKDRLASEHPMEGTVRLFDAIAALRSVQA